MADVLKLSVLLLLGAAFGSIYWLLPPNMPDFAETISLLLIGGGLGIVARGLEWLLWHRRQPKKPQPSQFKIRL